MRHDLLSDMLSMIRVGDNAGKKYAYGPASEMVKDVLMVMQKEGFIGEFEFVDNKRGGKFKVGLKGVVNNAKAVRPRFSVTVDGIEKYERRYLPASGFGIMIITTSHGIMTHAEAKKQKLGGKVLAYVY